MHDLYDNQTCEKDNGLNGFVNFNLSYDSGNIEAYMQGVDHCLRRDVVQALIDEKFLPQEIFFPIGPNGTPWVIGFSMGILGLGMIKI